MQPELCIYLIYATTMKIDISDAETPQPDRDLDAETQLVKL